MRRSTGKFAMAAWCCAAVLTPARGERLTLATYNLENYGAASRMTVAGFRPDYPKPEAQKEALRRVIRDLHADVIVVQEMGGPAYLEELRRDLRQESCDYPHAAIATAGDAERRLAVLSRRPLRDVVTHADLTFPYLGGRESVKRGLLEATIATAAGDVTLFALHLKSRFTERPEDPASAQRRAAEATAIRDRILRRFPTPAAASFIILGDCNDNRTSRALTFLQRRGRTEIAVLVSAADSRGEVWSHVFRREESYARVDHILVSPALRPAVVTDATRIHDGPGVAEASDHRPVVLVLDLPSRR